MKKRLSGSLTVEAAIVIPFIIVIMLPFIYILRSLYVYECVRSAVHESVELLESVLYLTTYLEKEDDEFLVEDIEGTGDQEQDGIIQYTMLMEKINDLTGGEGIKGLLKDLGLQQVVRYLVNQITKEQNLEAWGLEGGSNRISYLKSNFFYEKDGKEDLFCVVAVYNFEFPFVKRFVRMDPVEIRCVGRAFVGKKIQDVTEAGENTNETETKTYYRIGSGTHYHTADCYLIAKETIQLSHEMALEQGYTQCRQCSPGVAGKVVVTAGGEKFHESGCRYIHPSLTTIDEKKIQEKGYTACSICIGGGEWFQ